MFKKGILAQFGSFGLLFLILYYHLAWIFFRKKKKKTTLLILKYWLIFDASVDSSSYF